MKATCAVVALIICLAAPARAQGVPADGAVSLAEAIALATAREPATRAARADVNVARGMRLQADLRANPTLSFERRQEPGGTDTATEIDVEWPLELFRRGPRRAAATADLAVAEHQEADVRRRLVGDVAAAYGDVAAAARQLAITDEVLVAAAAQLDLLRARATQGATPTLDRDLVDVEVMKIQAERMVQAGRSERALVRLKRLLGVSPDAPLRVTQSLDELQMAFSVERVTVAERSDVQASAAQARAAAERLGAARSAARPDVTVFGSYMRMDAGFPQQGFSQHGVLDRVRGQFNYVAAGAMVTVPLWNREQGSIAAAMAARDGAEARAEAARLTAASEVAEASAWHDQARRVVSLHADGIRPLARRNLETVRETYQLGRATVFDVLAEQRRYLDTERAYTDALTEAFLSRVSLNRAAGDIR